MELRSRLDKLLSTTDVTLHYPSEAHDALVKAANWVRDEPAGSLLATHLSAGSMMTISALYLEGNSDEEICAAAAERTEGKPPSARSLWNEACKLFATLGGQAVQDAMSRTIPTDVRDCNRLSGKADVLDLPDAIAGLALETAGIGGDTLTRQAGHEAAATMLLIVLKLLTAEVDEDWAPIGATAYRRLYNELVGAAALDILGVCPEGKQPKDVIQKLMTKRVKELIKAGESLQAVPNS